MNKKHIKENFLPNETHKQHDKQNHAAIIEQVSKIVNISSSNFG